MNIIILVFIFALHIFANTQIIEIYYPEILSSPEILQYESQEIREYRLKIIQDNLKKIILHNKIAYINKEVGYTLKPVAKFLDQTFQQFQSYASGTMPSTQTSFLLAHAYSFDENKDLIIDEQQQGNQKQTLIQKPFCEQYQQLQNQALRHLNTFLNFKASRIIKYQQKQTLQLRRCPLLKHVSNKIYNDRLKTQELRNRAFLSDPVLYKNIDWTCYAGPVRNQGVCDGCYAFAVTDSLTAMMRIYNSLQTINLSVQDIIDCGSTFASTLQGCSGGQLECAFAYAKKYGFLEQRSYPFLNSKERHPKNHTPSCRGRGGIFNRKIRYNISTFVMQKGCENLALSLNIQPVVVSMSIEQKFMFMNISDINDAYQCKNKDKAPNHAVLIVGYQKGKGYKVKNSFGTEWGEKGYFYLKQGSCNVCNFFFHPVPSESFGLKNYYNNKKAPSCS